MALLKATAPLMIATALFATGCTSVSDPEPIKLAPVQHEGNTPDGAILRYGVEDYEPERSGAALKSESKRHVIHYAVELEIGEDGEVIGVSAVNSEDSNGESEKERSEKGGKEKSDEDGKDSSKTTDNDPGEKVSSDDSDGEDRSKESTDDVSGGDENGEADDSADESGATAHPLDNGKSKDGRYDKSGTLPPKE